MSHHLRGWWFIAAILVAGSGCASMDRGHLRGPIGPDRTVHDVPVHGWQVEVDTHRGVDDVEGELLAVDDDRIYVLRYRPYRVWTAPRLNVKDVELDLYPSHALGYGLWSLAGLVSTLSHGWIAAITAPIWLVTGITVVAVEAKAPEVTIGPAGWHALSQYARFPAGPPPGLLHHVESEAEPRSDAPRGRGPP